MTRCVLHIGVHKTGTTSIQHACDQRRERLLARGINYLDLSANHSSPLFSLLCDDPDGYSFNIRHGLDTPERVRRHNRNIDARLATLLAANRSETILVSGEDLSNLGPAGVRRLRQRFEPSADTFRIIAYVREPSSWISSMAQQYLKFGRRLAELAARPRLPDYRRRIAPFIDVFGREQVDIRVYSKTGFPTGGLLADFTAAIGADPDLLADAGDPRDNASLSMEAALLLDAANTHFGSGAARDHGAARRLSIVLDAIPGQPFVLPAELDDATRQTIESDLAWLHGVMGREVFAIERRGPVRPQWSVETITAIGAKLAAQQKRIEALSSQDIILKARAIIGRNPDKARRRLERALARWPNEPRVHFALSRAWKKLGDHERATEAARTAIRLSPDTPRYRKWLAKCEAVTPASPPASRSRS